MAAGVPKPLAPSIMKAKAQPIIISCAMGLGLMLPNHWRMTARQPVASIMRLKKIAPKMTVMGVRVATMPAAALALSSMKSFLK